MLYTFTGPYNGLRVRLSRSHFFLVHDSFDVPQSAKLLKFWFIGLKSFCFYLYKGNFFIIESDGEQIEVDFENSINRVRSCRLVPDDLPY